MTDVTCYIWGTPAKIALESSGDFAFIDSPRAGGAYQITGRASTTIANLSDFDRAKLTTWLCNQRAAGIQYPLIDDRLITDVKRFPQLTTSQRVQRALLYFNNSLRVGQVLTVYYNDKFGPGDEEGAYPLAAQTESVSKGELSAFLRLLEQMGLVEDTTKAMGLSRYTPSASGWLEIDKLVAQQPSATQVFVAMWFNPSMDDVYLEGFEPAIRESGYQAVRIDKKEHSNKIDDVTCSPETPSILS
jgi:hypothetical protein